MRFRGSFRPAGNRLRAPTNILLKGQTIVVPYGDSTSVQMWTNWPWANWLKPQIDLAVARGANCFTIKGPPGAALNGGLSQSVVAGDLRQFLDYTASIGCYVYACIGQYEGTPTQNINNAGFVAGVHAPYPHVVGIDAWNETFNMPADYPTAAQAIMAAVRSACSIPVTCSVGNGMGPNLSLLASVAAYCDFIDVHPYAPIAPDWAYLRAQPWWKPFIIGEAGSNVAAGASTQTAFYNGLASTYATQRDCFGVVGFCMVDYDNGQWGMYDTVPGGTLRTQISSAFDAWPKHA